MTDESPSVPAESIQTCPRCGVRHFVVHHYWGYRFVLHLAHGELCRSPEVLTREAP